MARIQTSNNVLKEIYMHFKPKELKIIAAYIYSRQNRLPFLDKDEKTQPLTSYYTNKLTRTTRPWTILERFRMGYQTFDVVMKQHPERKLAFAIADVQPDGGLDSGSVVLEPKVLQESKEVWDAIFSPGGLGWGNEAKLKSYVQECDSILEAYGFKKLPDGESIPPLAMADREMSDMNLDDFEVEEKEQETSMVPSEQVEKKHRGRPKKEVAVA